MSASFSLSKVGPFFLPARYKKILLIVTSVLLLLRLLHPTADFPAHSKWIYEPGRYTDEGWYASGAIHHAFTGHWIVAGDFNPVVCVPLWSVIVHAVFTLTGVSMAAARTTSILFGIALTVLATMLFRRHYRQSSWIVFVLLAASSTLFVFSRLALLEVPMMAFCLTGMLLAPRRGQSTAWRVPLSALLLAAAVLIKSSALFLLPAILLYTWQQNREPGQPLVRSLRRPFAIATVVATLLCIYFAAIILPNIGEARVLSNENPLGLQWRSIEKIVRLAFRLFTWSDPVLYLAALAAVVLSLRTRALRQSPLFPFCVAWIFGYGFFCVLHLSSDPRYFVVFNIPLAFLAVLLYEESKQLSPITHRLAAVAICIAAVLNTKETLGFILHPQYSFDSAAQQLALTIHNSGDPHPLVLGHGAIESTLFTRIDALDNMGTFSIGEKLDTYHPGWLVLWSDDRDFLRSPDLLIRYQSIPLGSWSVMDQPTRSHLLLFRLQPR
jgi:hypothetical protein